ncbi:MAG: dTDP-4-dehydrorhamnose reductase [Acidimicrobiales bacterium]
MRVMITGAGGQLGRELETALAGTWEVTGLDRARLDVGDRDAVLQALGAVQPDAVIHTAAWTAVDACEGDPRRAWRTNCLGTRHVAEGAAMVGAHLCYLSSDYVFDGTADRPYTEWDQVNPLSVYGRSKLGGESECREGSTIVRTSWLCGAHGPNIVASVLRMAREHAPLRFVDDQRGCPTFTADLAGAIRRLVLERRPGTYHVTNQGDTTWHGLARAILEETGQDPDQVEPITTAQVRPVRAAARPAYSVLADTALRMSGLAVLPEWRESLGVLVRQLVERP